MSALTRTQKIILIVFVFLDLAIIAGLVGIIITTMRNTTKPTPLTVVTATKTTVVQPTWTPTMTPIHH